MSTDHEFLVHAFSQVLESLGVTGAADLLKERNFSEPDHILEPQTIQAISFYFQLLNLVEEHGSGRSSREREKELGGDAEPGRWGRIPQAIKGCRVFRAGGKREAQGSKSGARSSPSIRPKQSAGRCLDCTAKLFD